jgi:hypothetical protein
MNSSGPELLKSLRQVRAFLRDTALLLSEAKRRMGEAGFTPMKPTLFWDSSTTIDYPDAWFPQSVVLICNASPADKRVVYADVLWEYLDKPALVREPLVGAGWVDFSPNVADWDRIGNPQHLHLHVPGRVDDGTLVPSGEEELKRLDKVIGSALPVHRAQTLAVPLVDIDTREALIRRVIDPVLNSLRQ